MHCCNGLACHQEQCLPIRSTGTYSPSTFLLLQAPCQIVHIFGLGTTGLGCPLGRAPGSLWPGSSWAFLLMDGSVLHFICVLSFALSSKVANTLISIITETHKSFKSYCLCMPRPQFVKQSHKRPATYVNICSWKATSTFTVENWVSGVIVYKRVIL